VSVTVDPGAPGPDDDVYDLHVGGSVITFSNFLAGSDAFGSFRQSADSTSGYSLRLYDLDDALSDTLDYVQLAGFVFSITQAVSEGVDFYIADGLGFIAFGRETAPEDMPLTGSASYIGVGRGIYNTAGGETYATRHDIGFSADFSTGLINGAATNFQFLQRGAFGFGSGDPVVLAVDPSFTFSALIASGTSAFSGTAISSGLGIAGEIEGAFFGDAGQPPEEAGLAYELGDPTQGDYLAGGAVLGRDP
jgi:hypothetical protein